MGSTNGSMMILVRSRPNILLPIGRHCFPQAMDSCAQGLVGWFSRHRATAPWQDRKEKMKLTAEAKGTFAIAPTPFHDDGRIDEGSIDRLIDFYEEVGCEGVTVLGIMGEAPKLDAAEAEQVAVPFVKRAKKMQVIVGMSAPGFATMRALARASMDVGAPA